MEQVQINKYEEYEELLNELVLKNEISAWNINGHIVERENFYLESDYKIESILEAKREGFEVNLYKKIEDEIGISSFFCSKYNSIEEFKEDLKIALFTCTKSKTKKYELSKKNSAEVNDSHIDYDSFFSKKFKENFKSKTLKKFFVQTINLLKEKIKKAQTQEIEFKVNSCEFLNSIRTFEHTSSQKIQKKFNQNSSYFELIITAKNIKTKKESEFVTYEKINDIFSFNFDSFFDLCIENTQNSSLAKQIKNYSGKIILINAACKDFFIPDLTMNSIIGHCSARLKHQKISNFNLGEEVLKAKKEKLTIHTNAIRKNNSLSEAFDGEGISGQRICLIKENKFMNFFASKQYGDYSNNTATGPFGVVEISLGNKNIKELTNEDDFVEIVSFSSFVPDMISGEFSCEIRQGFRIKNGIKTPIKGGLFNGNIFKILENMEISNDEMDVPGYVGPKAIKFYDADIVGM